MCPHIAGAPLATKVDAISPRSFLFFVQFLLFIPFSNVFLADLTCLLFLICVAQMSSGFKRLLSVADDLVLDIPDAMHLLSLFLGRAIVDEVLPPAFLAAALPSLPDGGLGVAVVQATGGWWWGGWETGAGRPQVGGGGLGGWWRTGGGSGSGRR